jgi:lysozyme
MRPIIPRNYAQRRIKWNKPKVMLVLIVAGMLLFSPEVRYRIRWLLDYPLHYKEYKQFGIRIPTGYSMHGIDVSRYQKKVDWARVRKMKVNGVRISFAFIKATEGTWMTDTRFDDNWDDARRQGIIRGAYHYLFPDLSPKDQAVHFIRTVHLRSGDLPPVVDVEEVRGLSKAQIQRYTKEFLVILEKHYKIKPILYTNLDYFKNYFCDVDDFKGYRFWIAHYYVTDLNMPGDDDWHFWQHSDKGNVNGINEHVDFNVFNGDSTKLRNLCLP